MNLAHVQLSYGTIISFYDMSKESFCKGCMKIHDKVHYFTVIWYLKQLIQLIFNSKSDRTSPLSME